MENDDSSAPMGMNYFMMPRAPANNQRQFDFRKLGASFSAESANSPADVSDDEDSMRDGSPDISFSLGDEDRSRPRQLDLTQWPVNLGVQFVNPATGKKRVQCNVCLKTFCDKGALKIHFSAVHLREMHKCTVEGCTMMFSSRRSRNRHSANPNPKLHSPHMRRKISAHDGRSSQPFPLLAALPRLPLPPPMPMDYPPRPPHIPLPLVMPEHLPLYNNHRFSTPNNIDKFLADFQKYNTKPLQQPQLLPQKQPQLQPQLQPQPQPPPPPIKPLKPNDEPEDLSMPSKRETPVLTTNAEKPNKRKRKSEKPTRCTQSADYNLSDDDRAFREEPEEPLELKKPKTETDDSNDFVVKKEEEDSDDNASSGKGLRLRSDLYSGRSDSSSEFLRAHTPVDIECDGDDELEIPIDEENPDRCTACGKIFHNHFTLRMHFRSDHLKLLHQCEINGCNAAFPSKRSRDRHSSNLTLHRKLLSTSSPKHPENGFNADLLNRLYADIKGLASTLETLKYRPEAADPTRYLSEAMKYYSRNLHAMRAEEHSWMGTPQLPRPSPGGVPPPRDSCSPLSASSPPVISPQHRDDNLLLLRDSPESIKRITSLCERQEQMYKHHVPVS